MFQSTVLKGSQNSVEKKKKKENSEIRFNVVNNGNWTELLTEVFTKMLRTEEYFIAHGGGKKISTPMCRLIQALLVQLAERKAFKKSEINV